MFANHIRLRTSSGLSLRNSATQPDSIPHLFQAHRLRSSFLLKTEGLPYGYLRLPQIKRENKLPVILSREEIWKMLTSAQLLKHKLLISLLYGCGLRCLEVRNIELKHLDFDRKLLHIVQTKGNKDRYVPLSIHLIRGPRTYINIQHSEKHLFEGTGNPKERDLTGDIVSEVYNGW